MPVNDNSENNLDKAFEQFGKRLRAKAKEQDPTKDIELQSRLEKINDQAPLKSDLFAAAESRLTQLKEEFHFELQTPQTPRDLIVHLLATPELSGVVKQPIPAADVYTQIHQTEQYRKLSSKAFYKLLKQLEKDEVLQLLEVKGTLVVQLKSEFLSEDESVILGIAARKRGRASLEEIMLSTQWPQTRVRLALESLIAKNMVTAKKSIVNGTRYQAST